MTEPLRFLHLIPEWAPPIKMMERAMRAHLPKDADPRKYAVELLLGAIKLAIAEPLRDHFVKHIDDLADAFEAAEGPEPDDDIEHEIWFAGLSAELVKLLSVDVVDTIGRESTQDWISSCSDSSADTLAEWTLDILVSEPAQLFNAGGVTVKHLDTLAERLTPAPVSDAIIKRQLKTGGDADTPLERPGDNDQPPADLLRRRRSPSVQRSSLTKAIQLALEALISPGCKEADIAAALGVSRPQAFNYRSGKTVFKPTDHQTAQLKMLYDAAISRLQMAWSNFEEAGLE